MQLSAREVWNLFIEPPPPTPENRDDQVAPTSRGDLKRTRHATFAVLWEDQATMLTCELWVNGVKTVPLDVSRQGIAMLAIELDDDANHLKWSVSYGDRHQRHAAYLKVGTSVIKLAEDEASEETAGVLRPAIQEGMVTLQGGLLAAWQSLTPPPRRVAARREEPSPTREAR